MLLPTHQIRIEEIFLDQVVALGQRGAVIVVADDQLFLAHQLEVIAIGRPEQHERFVEQADARGHEVRRVIGNVRCPANPALADQILPGRPIGRVHVPMGHQAFAGLG
ncbi:hypothetical protein D3C84_879490 [compost metagenome]